MSLLPLLWDQSGEEHLLKQAILTILVRIVDALKEESTRYHPLVLPLIKHAVEPGSVSSVPYISQSLTPSNPN